MNIKRLLCIICFITEQPLGNLAQISVDCIKTNAHSATIILHNTRLFQHLFSEQSTPCVRTLSQWSPYFYDTAISGTHFPLPLTFTYPASFLTSPNTHKKAPRSVGVMHLVPPVTEQCRKWCTAAGEHVLARYHSLSLLFCYPMHWVNLLSGSKYRSPEEAPVLYCTPQMHTMWWYMEEENVLCSQIKMPVHISHLHWPSAPFMIHHSPSKSDTQTSLTQAFFSSELPGPSCPLQQNPASPPEEVCLQVAQ